MGLARVELVMKREMPPHLLAPPVARWHSEGIPAMTRHVMVAALLLLVSAAPAVADEARDTAKKHVEFGIAVAQKGLWREAIYRWDQATKIDPSYSAAFNNLAVAYEHEGEFDKARKAYERAIELDPENQMLRQNYELFKEINDRTSRRGSR
jgi:Tfp pilus assembly protein PilF